MPPIIQPVAFVPYVTQDQPLMQYLPSDDGGAVAAKPPVKGSVKSAAAPAGAMSVRADADKNKPADYNQI